MINYIVIGGGWRAEFYLRIAGAMPDMFNVSAICVRNPERAKYLSEKFNVKVVKTVEEALQESFDFIVNCINKENIADLSVELADKGYYVLSETPIMKAPKPGHCYDRIQVAEQFHLKGTYQAIKKIIDLGIIGTVNYINISVAHDYHAMSLVRFLLNDYEQPKLLGEFSIDDIMLKSHGRTGEFQEKRMEDTAQKIRVYKFKAATVVYDYNTEQYFSPIRKDRLLIRGTRGEIENGQVRYFNKNNEFVYSDIHLLKAGLLDGFYDDKIIFGDEILFKFPFKEARLSEEETAIAECLIGMSKYIKTKNKLYSYEKAFEDYISFYDIKLCE